VVLSGEKGGGQRNTKETKEGGGARHIPTLNGAKKEKRIGGGSKERRQDTSKRKSVMVKELPL